MGIVVVLKHLNVKRVLHKKYTTLKNQVEVVFDKGNCIFQELHGAYVAVTYTMCIPELVYCANVVHI